MEGQQPKSFQGRIQESHEGNAQEAQTIHETQVTSLVESELNKTVRFEDQVNDEEKYIMSMVQAAVTKTLNQKSGQQS